MLKILFVLHYPNPFSGAAWTRIFYLAQFFKNQGHKVDVAGVFSASTFKKAGWRVEEDIGILNITPVIMMQSTLVLILNILCSTVSSFISLILIRPDTVIISVPNGETALGAYIAAYVFRRRIFFDYRDEWEDHIISTSKSTLYRRSYQLLKRIMTWCYRHSNMVIAVTQPFAQSLCSRGVNNLKIVSNGADLTVFKPHDQTRMRKKIGLNPSDYVFIFSGTIGLYYRLDVVVKALQKLKTNGCVARLLLLGNGGDLEMIMNLAKEIQIENQILYLGTKNDKTELVELICCADMGLIPYDSNPLWKNSIPVKALEYLACGIPIIATAHEDSLISTLIRDNGLGFTSPPEDSEELSTVMMKFRRNDSILDYKNRALALMKERFDRQKLAAEFLEIISVHR